MAAIGNLTSLLRPIACQPGALSFLGSTIAPYALLAALDHALERFVHQVDVIANAPAQPDVRHSPLAAAVIAQKLHRHFEQLSELLLVHQAVVG
jgi:hypothetical protein